MGSSGEFRQQAEGRAVAADGHDGAGGAVDADAHDLRRGDLRLLQNARHGLGKHVEVILRVLERPAVGQGRAVRQRFVHDAVRVFIHGGGRFPACFEVYQHGSPGKRPVIHSYCIPAHMPFPLPIRKNPFYDT